MPAKFSVGVPGKLKLLLIVDPCSRLPRITPFICVVPSNKWVSVSLFFLPALDQDNVLGPEMDAEKVFPDCRHDPYSVRVPVSPLSGKMFSQYSITENFPPAMKLKSTVQSQPSHWQSGTVTFQLVFVKFGVVFNRSFGEVLGDSGNRERVGGIEVIFDFGFCLGLGLTTPPFSCAETSETRFVCNNEPEIDSNITTVANMVMVKPSLNR
jgi:hypothetical protein